MIINLYDDKICEGSFVNRSVTGFGEDIHRKDKKGKEKIVNYSGAFPSRDYSLRKFFIVLEFQ